MTAATRPAAEWIAHYYELCGTKQIDAAMEYWAPEGVLRFANEEPLVGRENIRATFKGFIDGWEKETHTLLDTWELPDGTVIFELDVHFRLHDGTELSVHGAAVNRVDGERFLEQRTFVDMSPVWAAIQAAAANAAPAA